MTDEGGGQRPADRPDPNSKPCVDCGHVWFAGERRHEYLVPDAERQDDPDVLCLLCRQRRGLKRAVEPDPGRWA
jgi:hypothetical protein